MIRALLTALQGWSVENGSSAKAYRSTKHYEAMAFVTATTWISHREDHHPEITVACNWSTVTYVYHAIDELSQNEFRCAAKVDALFDL